MEYSAQPPPPPPPPPVDILFLSNISVEKGALTLLHALALLKKRRIPFQATIAGPFASTTEQTLLLQASHDLDISHSIDWTGPLQGIEKFNTLHRASIFCFPTHYHAEGFPLVLLEAMAHSLPVVSTRWRGIPEIVQENETGFLVPINDPSALADRLAQLASNPPLRESLGRAARKRFETPFTIQTFRHQMETTLATAS